MTQFAIGDHVAITSEAFLRRNRLRAPVQGIVEAVDRHGPMYAPGHVSVKLSFDEQGRTFVADPEECELISRNGAEKPELAPRPSTIAKVGDLVQIKGSFFRVTGVYLGAVGVQNLIGLECVTSRNGSAHGRMCYEMLIPEELLSVMELYRKAA